MPSRIAASLAQVRAKLTGEPPPASAKANPSEAPAAPSTTAGWVRAAGGRPPATPNPYGITQKPLPSDWSFQGAVQDFQKQVPPKVQKAMAGATDAQLKKGISRSWTQEVSQGGTTQKMTVELTKKLIPVPYEQFTAKLPASQWGGPNLARYLGGEVQPLAYDAQGRPTKQLERMVLAQDDLAPLLPQFARKLAGKFANDMTKAETITYGADKSRVDWRVYGSDNGSTLADVGSVTFEKAKGGTLVTFHSAHKLGVPGLDAEVALPAALVRKPLEGAFLAHANHYAQVVE